MGKIPRRSESETLHIRNPAALGRRGFSSSGTAIAHSILPDLLSPRVTAPCMSRMARTTMSKVEVVVSQHAVRRGVAFLRSEEPGHHSVSHDSRRLPLTALERWVQVSELAFEPGLPAF